MVCAFMCFMCILHYVLCPNCHINCSNKLLALGSCKCSTRAQLILLTVLVYMYHVKPKFHLTAFVGCYFTHIRTYNANTFADHSLLILRLNVEHGKAVCLTLQSTGSVTCMYLQYLEALTPNKIINKYYLISFTIRWMKALNTSFLRSVVV